MTTLLRASHIFASIPPWFWVVVLPFVAIVTVCGFLIGFAIVGADDPVKDNYYKEGRMINAHFAADEMAAELDLEGRLSIDPALKQIQFRSQSPDLTGTQLLLSLSHPAIRKKDLSVPLVLVSSQVDVEKLFVAPLKQSLEGRWYVQLENLNRHLIWRLKGEVNFSKDTSLHLHAMR